jgi:hypothetical protein
MRRARIIPCIALIAALLAGRANGESPYRRCASMDGWIAGASAAAGLGAVLVSTAPAPLAPREIEGLSRESVNAFDRGATWRYSVSAGDASDILVGAVAASPLALLLDGHAREDWETCALMYAETMAIAVILPAYAKGTVNRIRPFVYNADAPWDEKTTSDARKSFFSRHTSVAFASAVYISTVYGDYHPASRARPYVWAGTLIAASAVGFMRYESGNHFPTDIVAGAVAGGVAGYIVPRLHRAGSSRLSIRPACPGAETGVTLAFAL